MFFPLHLSKPFEIVFVFLPWPETGEGVTDVTSLKRNYENPDKQMQMNVIKHLKNVECIKQLPTLPHKKNNVNDCNLDTTKQKASLL